MVLMINMLRFLFKDVFHGLNLNDVFNKQIRTRLRIETVIFAHKLKQIISINIVLVNLVHLNKKFYL